MEFVAILSSTVLTPGTFQAKEIPFPASLEGIPHYIGHPATRALIEALDAEKAPDALFGGLEVGQSYLAVPLQRNPREGGYTQDVAISDISELKAMLVTRIA